MRGEQLDDLGRQLEGQGAAAERLAAQPAVLAGGLHPGVHPLRAPGLYLMMTRVFWPARTAFWTSLSTFRLDQCRVRFPVRRQAAEQIAQQLG